MTYSQSTRFSRVSDLREHSLFSGGNRSGAASAETVDGMQIVGLGRRFRDVYGGGSRGWGRERLPICLGL
jgi:hypothetical protein